MDAQRTTRLVPAIGFATFAVAVLVFARGHWGSVYDDALIYLRYARNLHNGCGVRFNCHGDAVEGFTGPLYLGALWLGSLVTDRLIDLCQVIGTACLLAAGALAIATATAVVGRDPRARAVAGLGTALVLALDPYVLLNANIGMETAMAAAAVALVAFAAVTARPRLTVVAAIACVLVRPEGALFVLALPLLPAVRRPRTLAAAIVAIVAITAIRYALFGAPLPNTYYAKSGGTWRHVELGLAYIATALRDFPIVIAAPLAWWAHRAAGDAEPAEPDRTTRGACAYVLIVAAAWLAFFVRSGGDAFEYSRLWFPLVPALTALAVAGLVVVARRFLMPRVAIAVPLAVVLVASVRAEVAHAIPDQATSDRVVEWAAIGTYLRAHYPRGTLVATIPIGAIGYYSSLPILDLVGLTEPAIARSGHGVPPELLTKAWIGHERNDTAYVLARKPALIVTTMHRDRAWQTLGEAKAGFWADLLLLEEIKAGRAPYHVRDAEVMPGDHVLMFERDDLAPAVR